MSSPLHLAVRFRIQDGKLDEFNLAASQCLEIVKNKDTQTLQYDWYFSDDNTECVVLEHYPNSDAVLQHMTNLGDKLGGLMQLSEFSVEIFGTPSSQLLEAASGLDIKIYEYFAGLHV